MNLLERVLTLLHANLNTVLEKTDDPEKILHQLHIDMRNQLVQVKTQVATAIAENRKLQQYSQEKTTEAESWLKRAEQSIQHGKDNNARSSLAHYNRINNQIQRYKKMQKEQEQLITTMRGALHQLETKIAEVQTTLDHLMTRKRIALSQQQIPTQRLDIQLDQLSAEEMIERQIQHLKAKQSGEPAPLTRITDKLHLDKPVRDRPVRKKLEL
jgi:phage shock protein A